MLDPRSHKFHTTSHRSLCNLFIMSCAIHSHITFLYLLLWTLWRWTVINCILIWKKGAHILVAAGVDYWPLFVRGSDEWKCFNLWSKVFRHLLHRFNNCFFPDCRSILRNSLVFGLCVGENKLTYSLWLQKIVDLIHSQFTFNPKSKFSHILNPNALKGEKNI